MKIILFAFALAILASHSYAQNVSQTGMAQPVCTQYKNPQVAASANALCRTNLIAALAALVNETFILPKPLAIVGAECGGSNAFYDKRKSAIYICYELAAELMNRVTREVKGTEELQGQIGTGALMFAFFHELGHAVIDLYDLPVFGREEDAADQIGVFMLIAMANLRPDVARNWPVGAYWFFQKTPLFFSRKHFADEHSVNPQRQFNVACWFYGSDQQKYLSLARYAKLPNSRAQRCPSEFEQLTRAVKQMLAPHFNRTANLGSSNTAPRGGESMAVRAARCRKDAEILELSNADSSDFVANCYRVNGVVTAH